MKMYNAPTIETVKLSLVDVITASFDAKGVNTEAYNLKATTAKDTVITHTNQGEEWQSDWN